MTAGNLEKVYGETLTLPGSAFTQAGMAPNEAISSVTLVSAGAAPQASVAGSLYPVTASAASGSGFNPSNYTFTYVDGSLLVKPRPLTITANSLTVAAGDALPAFKVSTGTEAGGGLVNGDSLASVTVSRSSESALSLLVPGGAVFQPGSASNYAITYGNGVLVVLPKPPLLTDADGGTGSGNGEQGFQLDDVGKAEVAETFAVLSKFASLAAQPAPDAPRTRGSAPPAPSELRELSTADIAQLLAGDGQSITVPVLQRLPLISFDPGMRQRLRAAAERAAQPAVHPARALKTRPATPNRHR